MEEIKKFLLERGYSNIKHEEGLPFVKAEVKGIDCIWNTQHKSCLIWLAGPNRSKLVEFVEQQLPEYVITQTYAYKKHPRFEDFVSMVDTVASHELDLTVKKGQIEFGVVSVPQMIAKTARLAVEVGNPDALNRGPLDRIDSLITIGTSVKVKPGDKSWREHVVPCKMILEEAVEMVKRGCSDFEIAMMVHANLFIVNISLEEQKYLDNSLKLQTNMPEGWKFGDDPFARLKAANILFK